MRLPVRFVVAAALITILVMGIGFGVAERLPADQANALTTFINTAVSVVLLVGLVLGLVSLVVNVPRAVRRFHDELADDDQDPH